MNMLRRREESFLVRQRPLGLFSGVVNGTMPAINLPAYIKFHVSGSSPVRSLRIIKSESQAASKATQGGEGCFWTRLNDQVS